MSKTKVLEEENIEKEAERKKEVEEERFREDLFYRLNVIPIHMPPVRERKGDIPLLVNHFLEMFSKNMNSALRGVSDEAMELLVNYRWPGNVRELRNVVERACLLSEGPWLRSVDIVLGAGPGATAMGDSECVRLPPEGCRMDDVEKELLRQALERTNGNRTRAAKLLGISRDQVRYKVEKFNLDAEDEAAT